MSVALFILALAIFCAAALVILIVAVDHEKKKEQKRREKVMKCTAAVKNGYCHNDCSMCEWGGYE